MFVGFYCFAFGLRDRVFVSVIFFLIICFSLYIYVIVVNPRHERLVSTYHRHRLIDEDVQLPLASYAGHYLDLLF